MQKLQFRSSLKVWKHTACHFRINILPTLTDAGLETRLILSWSRNKALHILILNKWHFTYFQNIFMTLKMPKWNKVGFSPFQKCCFIYFNERSSKMMKNAFYFILKVLFVVKIIKSWSFDHVAKTVWLER